MKFIKIAWEQYEKDTLFLAKKLKDTHIDIIVAISRGGLIVARILSDMLALPVSHITIVSYQDLKQNKSLKIVEEPNRLFDNHTVLLVDEIGDSGRTFTRAKKFFNRFERCRVLTFAPYVKTHTDPLPDFWLKKLDAWIVFPYEIRETYESLLKLLRNRNKVLAKMKKIGFKKWEFDIL